MYHNFVGMGRELGLGMTEGAGTPLYRAPEVDSGEYDAKADILSLGIILYELMFGEQLFTQQKAKNLRGLKKLWKETDEYYDFKTAKRKISFETMQFLQYSLQKDSGKRLTADELYELDFIKNAYNDEEYSYPSADWEAILYLTKHSEFDMME